MQNNGSQIVQGQAGWRAAKNAFEPTTWMFRLVLVQPGLSLAKLKKANAGAVLRPLLASATDYAQTSGAVLDVWCSN
jgi:hypothetical protein